MWILPKNLHTSAYVPGTEVLNLDLNESSQLCAQLLFVRSKPSPLRTWLQKWKRDLWTRHLFGRILKPSHGLNFVTAWTFSLEATHASHSAQQDSEKEQTTQDTSGRLFQPELLSCDQVSVSLKTLKDISRWGCPTLSKTWDAWAIEQRGAYSARLSAARLISAKESSSWPTASTRDHKGGYEGGRIRDGKVSMDTLDVAVQAYSAGGLLDLENHNTVGSRPESWLTPRANEPTADNNFVARNADRGEHCHVSLTSQAKAWATPEGMAGGKIRRGGKRKDELLLTGQVKAWATPRSCEHKGNGPNSKQQGLCNQVVVEKSATLATGKLNPRWVETLMGLPVGWTMPSCASPVTIALTNCASLATESSLQQQL